MNSWHTYPSIYNLGHAAVKDLLEGMVIVEEKVDGSQFSFGIDEQGELHIRSKGAVIHPEAPEGMFKKAVDVVKELTPLLHPGWTYRGEYLAKPKHNTLAYDRVPNQHIIIFDINIGEELYLDHTSKEVGATRLGLETVPLLHYGVVEDIATFRKLLDTTSILGGQKIEGVVVKPLNYDHYGPDKKVLMGKFVSEAFKEVHSGAWKEANPNSGDIIQRLGSMYQSQARWQKAVQHLREAGQIQDSPSDIGLLMKEVPEDILREYQEEIQQALFIWAWPQIRRIVTAGLPEWYKEQLLKRQFEEGQ